MTKAVSDIAEKLRRTVEKNHDEVVAANAKFVKETFKTPEEGGAYAQVGIRVGTSGSPRHPPCCRPSLISI